MSEFINTGKSITSIDIIDDYTVVIKTKEPIPWLANNFYKLLVMDEESTEARDPGEMEARPIGSGAYKFCEIGCRF